MDYSPGDREAQLGVLYLALSSATPGKFGTSPVRSLHAALSRRLELLDPDLSQALHDAPEGAHSSDHPWSISPLIGPLHRSGGYLVTVPGEPYRVRITALVPEVLAALVAAFDPATPLGREPVFLENARFDVVPQESHLESLATYASLLTAARPNRRINLVFRSPTAFRSRQPAGLEPALRLCIEGYLRKWNTFADVVLPEEPLLEYAEQSVRVVSAELRPASMQLGKFYEKGVAGTVTWEAEAQPPALLRLINALVDYAFYCGTGARTALGMGQTVRMTDMTGKRVHVREPNIARLSSQRPLIP